MGRDLGANALACEALVNCWIREGGRCETPQPGLLTIPLADDRELRFLFDDRTSLGDLRLRQAPSRESREMSARELAETLVGEMSRITDTSSRLPSDWQANVAHSAEVLARILAANDARDESQFDFLASEQSLFLGHRFHPSPKSRIGFSNEELEKYSPEWRARFRLRFLRVADDEIAVRGERAFAARWASLMAPIFGEGWIVPIHPWQAARALVEPEIQRALRSGRIVDLGEAGPEFHATSSVRTLYQPAWDFFVKTSLRVRITNCFRENLPQELETLASLREMLRELVPADDSFRILDEPLSLDLKTPSTLRFGAIFREGLAAERSRGAEPLLAAALFGDRHFSLARLERLVGGRLQAQTWFARYCKALVPPVLGAFFEQGVMFEPHLQNILLCERAGGGLGFLQRDLDNVKVVAGSAAAKAIAAAPEAVRNECLIPQDVAWKRLVYCLVVNHLAEAIATIARLDSRRDNKARVAERDLWMILRDVVLDSFHEEPLARRLVDEKALWAKKNLLTRVTRTADREAPFAAIPNPLNRISTP